MAIGYQERRKEASLLIFFNVWRFPSVVTTPLLRVLTVEQCIGIEYSKPEPEQE